MPKRLGNGIGLIADDAANFFNVNRYWPAARLGAEYLNFTSPINVTFIYENDQNNWPGGFYQLSSTNAYINSGSGFLLTYDGTKWVNNFSQTPYLTCITPGFNALQVGAIFRLTPAAFANGFTTLTSQLISATRFTNTPTDFLGLSPDQYNIVDYKIDKGILNLSKYAPTTVSTTSVTIENKLLGSAIVNVDTNLYDVNVNFFRNLKTVNFKNIGTLSSINIDNNSINTITFTGTVPVTSITIDTPSLNVLSVGSNTCTRLSALNITGTPPLTNIFVGSNIPYINVNTGSNITNIVARADNTNLSSGSISLFNSSQFNWYTTPIGAITNNLIKKNWTVSYTGYTAVVPITSYIPTRSTFNKLILLGPGTYTTSGRFLSGEYTKTGQIVNNLDVFANNNNSFVWFNSASYQWVVTNPGISGMVYLSASVLDYLDVNNPPTAGWSGTAFNSNTVAGGTNYFTYTQIIPTDTILLSGYSYVASGANPIYRYNPAANNGKTVPNNFLYSSYNFTGLGWSTQTSYGTRIQLISPIHFIYPTHMTLWAGNTYRFYQNDGTSTTRTILSSNTSVGGTDIAVGILSSPLPLSGIRPFRTLSSNTYNLLQNGKTKILLVNQRSQVSEQVSNTTATSAITNITLGTPSLDQLVQRQFKRSLMINFTNNDDSSSPFLMPYSDDELLLLGYTQFSGSPCSGPNIFTPTRIAAINARMAALEAQFGMTYGYTLSTV